MFGQVWKWAGEYRLTERNIGVAPYQIPIKLKALFDDVKFWIENNVLLHAADSGNYSELIQFVTK